MHTCSTLPSAVATRPNHPKAKLNTELLFHQHCRCLCALSRARPTITHQAPHMTEVLLSCADSLLRLSQSHCRCGFLPLVSQKSTSLGAHHSVSLSNYTNSQTVPHPDDQAPNIPQHSPPQATHSTLASRCRGCRVGCRVWLLPQLPSPQLLRLLLPLLPPRLLLRCWWLSVRVRVRRCCCCLFSVPPTSASRDPSGPCVCCVGRWLGGTAAQRQNEGAEM